MAGLPVTSSAYTSATSPQFEPWDLRYAPDCALLDLTRLEWWDRWRVMWVQITGWYYLRLQED